MDKKHKSIRSLIENVENTFGHDIFSIEDYWDDFYAIGLKKDEKLIYLSNYKVDKGNYSYECEILLDDPERPYIVHSEEENVSEGRILEVINFFSV